MCRHISMSTREWKDGLLSSVMRDLGRIPNENPKWMILDGDLDANWIESMNSVMVQLNFFFSFRRLKVLLCNDLRTTTRC